MTSPDNRSLAQNSRAYAEDIAAQQITNGKVTNSHRAYLGIQVAHGVDDRTPQR